MVSDNETKMKSETDIIDQRYNPYANRKFLWLERLGQFIRQFFKRFF